MGNGIACSAMFSCHPSSLAAQGMRVGLHMRIHLFSWNKSPYRLS